MSAEPNIIGIGAVVSGRAEYDAAQARVERLKAELEADRSNVGAPLDVGFLTALILAVVGWAIWLLIIQSGKQAPSPTAPAAAIPCPGPGLNEHTYIVLANDAGQIRLQSCTTVHILGR